VRTPQDVTDTELGILQVLWEQGPATRRRLTDVLYPGGGPAHYATVQKLLERLEAKGYVRSSRARGVLEFAAVLGRDELITRRLQAVAEKLCGGSFTPLLTHLVRLNQLTARELLELRGLIDDLSKQPRPKGDRD
jgi:predicted transcriptional regulator